MTSESPAFNRFVPDAIAHPSTPKDPMYFLDHCSGGEGDGDLLRGILVGVGYLVIKLFKVGVGGTAPDDVVISPCENLSGPCSWDHDPSKNILTALSIFPPDTSWRLCIALGDSSSPIIARSCSG